MKNGQNGRDWEFKKHKWDLSRDMSQEFRDVSQETVFSSDGSVCVVLDDWLDVDNRMVQLLDDRSPSYGLW